MKVIIRKMAMVVCLGLMSSIVFAQKEDSKVKIRIEKNINGKTEVVEREIDATGMSDEERDALVESIQDSLMGDMKGHRKMKIMMDEDRKVIREGNEDGDFEFEFHSDDRDSWNNDDRNIEIYKKGRKGGNDWSDDFQWEMQRFGDNMKMLGEEIPRNIEKHLPRVYAWTDNVFAEVGSSPIRSLDVFPNKPDSDVINVRFFAPAEGDINISVLDTKGKIVAQKEAKAFKGEYVGQINLKKGVKGTHFVIVSQGDDGVSRKVVLD